MKYTLTLFASLGLATTALSKVPYAETVFDQVWNTVNESFYDPNFGGLDWDAYGVQYREAVLNAQTRAEMNELLNEMLLSLNHSHMQVADWAGGVFGMDILPGIASPSVEYVLIDGEFVVSYTTDPEIKVGDVIVAVDGHEVVEMTEVLMKAGFQGSGLLCYTRIAMDTALSGGLGTSAKVDIIRDGEKESVELARKLRTDVERIALPGSSSEHEVELDFQELEDGVVYLHFSVFVPLIMPEIRNFIKSISEDSPGLIIDLRGNPGGTGLMAPGLFGMLTEENRPCGRMLLRSGELVFNGFAQSNAYLGKVAVLVDEGSASTSEIFAAAIQDNERGQVFGANTSGMVLGSVMTELRNGSTLQHVIANVERANGSMIEGIGVQPDVSVPWTHEDVVARRDPVLDVALDYILDRAMETDVSEMDETDASEPVTEEQKKPESESETG